MASISSCDLARVIFLKGYAGIVDVDGTSKRDSDPFVPAVVVSAMEYLRDAGPGFAFASGRDRHRIHDVLEDYNNEFTTSSNQGAYVSLSNGIIISKLVKDDEVSNCNTDLQILHKEFPGIRVVLRFDSGLPNVKYHNQIKNKLNIETRVKKIVAPYPNLLVYPQQENCDIAHVKYTKKTGAQTIIENDPKHSVARGIFVAGNASNDKPLYEAGNISIHIKGEPCPDGVTYILNCVEEFHAFMTCLARLYGWKHV